jgi:hypothetical protein
MWKEGLIMSIKREVEKLCNENHENEINEFIDCLVNEFGVNETEKERLKLYVVGFSHITHEILTVKDSLKI